jgi:glucokinase
MSKYYYCIDVGGTDIKAGIVDDKNNIIIRSKTPTKTYFEKTSLAETLFEIMKSLESSTGLLVNKASGIGIGLPGLVDDSAGIIKYINSLKIKNYNIREDFKKYTSVPVRLANDAELATLAEFRLGAGKGYNNLAMLTLGTGIGSGIIVDGKPLRSSMPFACELGHISITQDENESFERLASTKALVNQTREAMENNTSSKMWQTYTPETVSGKTVFEYKDIDKTANDVFERYIRFLGTGVVTVYNIFTPEVIVIGGGVSGQKSALIKPLTQYVNSHIFTRNIGQKVKIISAKFMNDAGILGARCLFN